MATENRLIYANTLDEMCRRQIESTWNHNVRPESWARAYEVFLDAINDSLTVDAVEVVRCKNCASGKGSTHKVCPLYKQGLMRDDDFCSYGERVTEEEC